MEAMDKKTSNSEFAGQPCSKSIHEKCKDSKLSGSSVNVEVEHALEILL
jgi:hypothetical protein